MAKVLQPISACFKKGEVSEEHEDRISEDEKKENDQNNQNDDSNGGLIWRMSSRLYNIGSGAVGLGVGSVKWAASTTYTVGTGVVSATQTVVSKVVPSALPKPKKE
ncbi:uncharacterized protein LOC129972332 [Argiope bruennichi]|uniref:Uncharacterized protein n=1 Tax=Argiope bruennichi TaxID=94029 RepID=A0A8T0FC05_ARGBR|nr:uncharacterized protein LOC129972332 [Argiope bruennichi]KAF8786870.1 hypothetical protein HNY73_008529 [Argiope bruennichi]